MVLWTLQGNASGIENLNAITNTCALYILSIHKNSCPESTVVSAVGKGLKGCWFEYRINGSVIISIYTPNQQLVCWCDYKAALTTIRCR
jgi:hypothetical protein